jgi:hypothetical protein
MNIKAPFCLAWTTMILISCGSPDNTTAAANQSLLKEDGRGCLQGLVRDGTTGERIQLKSDAQNGIFIVARNLRMPAKRMVDDLPAASSESALGEYYLCGFPLDEIFPLVVIQDGYQNFEAEVRVSSTLPQRTLSSTHSDITRQFPTLIANFDLYPKGAETQDLQVNVFHLGAPMENAQVSLYPTTSHILNSANSQTVQEEQQPDGDLFRRAVAPVRQRPLVAHSNAQGLAFFQASDLVLGLGYRVLIVPANRSSSATPTWAEDVIYVGYREQGNHLHTRPYEINISLQDQSRRPDVVASSIESSGFDSTGRIVLHFDMDVELSPASERNLRATLLGANSNGARIPSGREAVTVEVRGRVVTLKPVWQVHPVEEVDRNVAIRYTGLVVRAVGETRSDYYKTIDPGYLLTPLFDQN